LDHAATRNVPVVMSYTGTLADYNNHVQLLQSDAIDKWEGMGNRDLGSRLENVITIGIGSVSSSDRKYVLGELLVTSFGAKQGASLDGAVDALHRVLPANASMRRISGALSSVAHDAKLDNGAIDAERVLSVLGGPAETMFGDYSNHNQLINNIADYSGVSREDILGKSKGADIVNARSLVAWALCNEMNFGYSEAGRKLGKDHATIMNATKKVKRVLGTDDFKLKPREFALKKFVSGWEEKNN